MSQLCYLPDVPESITIDTVHRGKALDKSDWCQVMVCMEQLYLNPTR